MLIMVVVLEVLLVQLMLQVLIELALGMAETALLEAVAMAVPVEAAGMAVEELIQIALLMMIKVGVEDPTLPLLVRIVNMCQKDI